MIAELHDDDHNAPQTTFDALGGEELRLELPGLTLAACAWGPRDGAPVLALHGWLDNAGSFAHLAPLLPDLRLVALDMAGHGRSGWRHETASYDFVNWLPELHHALEALGWSRCALLGHSLGAGVAVCFAGTFPDRVERLALIDGMGPLSTPAEEAPGRLQKAIKRQRRIQQLRPAVYPDRAAMAERLCAAIPGLDEPAAQTLLRRGTREDDSGEGYCWTYDPRLRGSSLLRLSEPQVAAFMKRVSCPTLLLRARQGWPVDADALARRCGYLGDALDLHEVEGCHHVHLVTPERVAPALRAFLCSGARE